MEQQKMQLREAWLEQAASFLIAYMVGLGLPETSVRVSCGWPSRRALANHPAVIGQCFPPSQCDDGRPQIFISPRIVGSVEVLGTLLHELIHAAIGCDCKHGKKFSRAAQKVGLDGPPTATSVGDGLRPILERFVAFHGSYPHAAINPVAIGPGQGEKAGSRLRLYHCQCKPPVKVRVARDEFRAKCLICKAPFSRVEMWQSEDLEELDAPSN